MQPPPSAPAPGPRPPWGAVRALKTLAAFLGAQLAVAGGVGLWVGLRHDLKGAYDAGGGVTLNPGLAIGAAVGGTLLAAVVVVHMIRRTEDGWATVGWARTSGRATALAALQGLALVAVLVLLGRSLPAPRQVGPLASLARAGGWARLGWAALAFFVAPPTEELMFRGALYAGLVRDRRPVVAGALTTAIFVGLHATEIGTYWPAWIAIGLLGALALRARVVTGSLVPAIALHATYNLGLVLAVYAAGH